MWLNNNNNTFTCISVCVCVCVKSLQSCLTLCDPMNCSPPGSPVHAILQARILGYHALLWVICLPNSGMKPAFFTSPAFAGGFFTTSTPLGSPYILCIIYKITINIIILLILIYYYSKIMYFTDAGRDCGQEEKGTTEDEMVGWHHRLDGCEFEWTPGVGDGQGSLACCDSWGPKELDTTEWLNWTELTVKYGHYIYIQRYTYIYIILMHV